MDWIEIEHKKLQGLNCNERVVVTFKNGQIFFGRLSKTLDGLVWFLGSTESGRKIKESITKYDHYAIIEEPKSELKYKTIEEFIDNFGGIVSKSKPAKSYVIRFEKHPHYLSYPGKNFKECEQKLLDWANDELD